MPDEPWGMCDWCSTAYRLQDGLLPPHGNCHGSGKRPDKLLTDDNKIIKNPEKKE